MSSFPSSIAVVMEYTLPTGGFFAPPVPDQVQYGMVEPFYESVNTHDTYNLPELLPTFDFAHQFYPPSTTHQYYFGAPTIQFGTPTYYPQESSFFSPEPPENPIPISNYSSLLPPVSPAPHEHSAPVVASPLPIRPVQIASLSAPDPAPNPMWSEHADPLEQCTGGPQIIFPTPSELLADLSVHPDNAPRVLVGQSNRSLTLTNSRTRRTVPPPYPRGKKPENQRKAYFRAVAENVGFQPTNPDTITSHEKKRYYLECLEHYVVWLREQVELAGKQPIPLERVSTYPGLNSRSIRTLLVHMQNLARKLSQNAISEENGFYQLKDQLAMATLNNDQEQRHNARRLDATAGH